MPPPAASIMKCASGGAALAGAAAMAGAARRAAARALPSMIRVVIDVSSAGTGPTEAAEQHAYRAVHREFTRWGLGAMDGTGYAVSRSCYRSSRRTSPPGA